MVSLGDDFERKRCVAVRLATHLFYLDLVLYSSSTLCTARVLGVGMVSNWMM